MVIERMTAADCDLYQEMLEEYIYESITASAFEEKYTKMAAKEKCIQLKKYIGEEKAIVFGAVKEDKLLGFIWAYEYPFREDTNRLYVSILRVHQQYRNCQIGKMLLDAVEEEAERLNYSAVFLHEEAFNEGALRFYHRMGYRDERVQVVKEIKEVIKRPKYLRGGIILKLSKAMVMENLDCLVELCYDNVKVHSYTEHFSYQEAVEKIKGLAGYLELNRAISYGFFLENSLVGFIWLYPYDYKNEHRYYIGEIQVKEQYRGLGIGSQLYEAAMASAFQLGIKHLYTHIDVANNYSRNMHRKVGFIDEMYQLVKNFPK